MPALRPAGASRSLTFLNAILMTTAMTVPAFGAVETVIVTAERKAEDIQTVPIAVTALTSQDLKAKQVYNFRDLQFYVPSVTYTKSNFGGAQFQIRGITTQFGLGAAIAQNENEVYIEAPALVTGEYYDVDRVEVSRGPQSTLYGRAATGGAVDIVTTKPDLDNFAARASMDYGEFATYKPDAMVNIPIINGELAARFALHASFHDGYEANLYNGPEIFPGGPVRDRVNSLGQVQGRASIRWEPSSDTTIDLTADVGYENDRRTRSDKQECHRDPSGVIGCLPDSLAFEPINTNSTLGVTLGSAQGLQGALTAALGGFTAQAVGNTLGLGKVAGNCGPGDPNRLSVFCNPASGPGIYALGYNIFGTPQTPELVDGPGSGATNAVAQNLQTSNTAFNPKYKTAGGAYLLNWQQKISDWLSATLDAGYIDGYQFTQENYNDASPENISGEIVPAVANFNTVFNFVPGFAHNAGAYDAAYFNVPGSLPLSNTNYLGPGFRNYGGIIDTTRGGILTKTPFNVSYDEDWFGQRESTFELRFQTAFEGPLNFSAGAFYMTYDAHNQYWVASTGLDWEAVALGAIETPAALNVPLVVAMPTFDAEYQRNNITSRSAFLEATWEIFPDLLKFIAGARFNDDREHLLRTPVAVGGGLLTDGIFPLGSTDVTLPVNQVLPSPALTGTPPGKNVQSTDLWTGRASLNYTPKLDFTQQTLVYFTASRGMLAGGLNVPNNGVAPAGVPIIYKPSTVDALELGTKNTLLDGTLQANLDAWYYNYENYQVGIIANRQALTLNVPARLFGLESEMIFQPTDALEFNFTLSLTQSEAGHTFLVDQRNPTNDQPGSILVKDLVTGSNCVIVPTSGGTFGKTPGDSVAPFGPGGYHEVGFYLPNGGNAAIDAPFGVPLVNYGTCNTAATNKDLISPANPTGSVVVDLAQKGFAYAEDVDPRTGLPTGTASGTGIARDLHGNHLPQVPFGQVGIGGQYTFKMDDNYTLVPRVDYYWQSSMQSRLWNDPGIDRVSAWDVMNLSVQLNAPDNKWYASVFAKNVFDKQNPTGIYLTDPTSALFTNVFTEDPRVVGVSFGTHW